MMAGKPNGSAKGRGLSRRATAALLCSLLAGTGVVTTASPASAAVTPVAPPFDIGVFPMRDFLGVGGWGVGAEMDIRVIRDGVQIGQAGPLELAADAELNGFGEVNHPGGICWTGVTPNLVAGDRVEAVDADGNGAFTVVQNVEVTQPATKVDADSDGQVDDIITRGMASNVAGTGRIAPALVEQRIINPDFNETSIGRRDVRAIFGDGLADGVESRGEITWDDPTPGSTDPHWTATYLNMVEPHSDEDTGAPTGQTSADLAVAGQSRMLAWERTNAAGDRIGMTLWEYGELGGPGMGGCPASDNFAVGGATPKSINTLTKDQTSLTLSGTATDVDKVTVTVDDHDPGTPAVTTTATVAKPASLDPAVALPGATTWNASIPMSEVLRLDDDTLVASATFGVVKETTTDQDTDGLPETAPVPVKTRASSPMGGANLNILKDLQVPAAPTAFPAGGRFTSAQSVTVSPDNEIEDVVRYRVGATPTTTATPTAASPVVPTPLSVTSTQTVNARSYDAAGNPSPVATFEYTIAPLSVPGAPTGVTAVAGNAQATVSWTAPADNGGSPITRYIVETWQGTTYVGERTAPADARSALVQQLVNGTPYTFRVVAVNAQGESRPTATPTAVTPTAPVTLPAAPTVTPASGTYTAAQSVTMTAAAGATIRYTVGTGTTVPADPTATTGTAYVAGSPVSVPTSRVIKVAAFNSAGRSTIVQRNYTINVAPAAPTVTPASGTYTTAQSMTMTAAAGTTIRYTVGTGTTVPADPTATTGTAYTGPVAVPSSRVVKVAAFSAAGTRSTVVQRNYTIATVPGAPVIGTAVAGAAGGAITATAVWQPPANTGGAAVNGYTVRALRMSATGTVLQTITSAVQPATARSFAMTLPVTGNYRFTVQARNAVGSGAQSARSNQVAGR